MRHIHRRASVAQDYISDIIDYHEETRLDRPQSCAVVAARYAGASDPVACFVAERCVTGRGLMKIGAELWLEHIGFCEECGERPGKQADFWTVLERHGFIDMGEAPHRGGRRHATT